MFQPNLSTEKETFLKRLFWKGSHLYFSYKCLIIILYYYNSWSTLFIITIRLSLYNLTFATFDTWHRVNRRSKATAAMSTELRLGICARPVTVTHSFTTCRATLGPIRVRCVAPMNFKKKSTQYFKKLSFLLQKCKKNDRIVFGMLLRFEGNQSNAG